MVSSCCEPRPLHSATAPPAALAEGGSTVGSTSTGWTKEHGLSATGTPRTRRPNRLLLAAEGPRALGELMWLQAARPLLATAPHGDGHPVLVLPGLVADDRSTVPLRRFLRRLGYRVHGWRLGTNVPSQETIRRLRDRLARLHAEDGQPMSIVGWSLGGIYAREIARGAPEAVRAVVTLGSPFRPAPGFESHAAPLVRALARPWGVDPPRTWSGDDRPLPVPSTSVFSRSDGIVPWQACVDASRGPHETIEVVGSHCGLGHHPAVLLVVADRLAQPPGGWRPMRIPAPWRTLLRRHTVDGAAASA
jgi:pimeloyl-ACP methyl ester carboxylesterase